MTRTANATSTLTSAVGVIPTLFRPTAVVRVTVIGMDNGANYPYPVGADLGTDSKITWYKSASSVNFTSANTCGPYGSCWSYIV